MKAKKTCVMHAKEIWQDVRKINEIIYPFFSKSPITLSIEKRIPMIWLKKISTLF